MGGISEGETRALKIESRDVSFLFLETFDFVDLVNECQMTSYARKLSDKETPDNVKYSAQSRPDVSAIKGRQTSRSSQTKVSRAHSVARIGEEEI